MMIEEKTYRFDCPVCHNALNAKPEDLKFGRLMVGFKCPVCNEERRVFGFQVSSTTIVRHK